MRGVPDRSKSVAGFHGRRLRCERTTTTSHLTTSSGAPKKAWMTSVDATHSQSSSSPLKGGQGRAEGKHMPQSVSGGLVVTSARIVRIRKLIEGGCGNGCVLQIPSERPQTRGKKAARGIPTRYASGSYTQTHGVISSSDLAMLKATKW